MTEKITPFDMVKLLDSNEAITEYLAQVLEDGDKTELIHALGYIAKAKGVAFKRERLRTKPHSDLKMAQAA
jgi:probable addiction module antidote protein